MPSCQDYENRLRQDTRQAFAPHFQSLQAELQSLRDSIAASVAQLEQKVAALETVDVPGAGETIRDALEGAARNTAQEKESLAQFALSMRRCETQEEILSLLLDGVSRYAPRVVLFVLRNEQFVGWASRGYSEETAAALASQPFPESDSPALTRALEAEDTLAISEVSAESRIFALLREEKQGPWNAFPLRALRRPVAVLLVTCAEGHSCDLQPISLMMHITGLCIENVALKILQEMKASSVPERPEPVVAAPETPEPLPVKPVATAEPESPVQPAARVEAVPQEVEPAAEVVTAPVPAQEAVAPAQQEQPAAAAVAADAPAAEPAASAPVAAEAYAAQATEAPPPVPTTAPAQTQPEPTAAAKPATPRDAGKLSEEERLHSDAKRFARLLVSEIKLYNEQRVAEGRANRDLYVRLKRDIDRSREMYEKRVSPIVSRKMDYFHDELIRILGENDPVTLGSDYPGSRVEN